MELKSINIHISEFKCYASNRTIMELKSWEDKDYPDSYTPSNRTIMELKLLSQFFLKPIHQSSNRTIMELK